MTTFPAPRSYRLISNQNIFLILGALIITAIVIFFARTTGMMEVPANTGTSSRTETSDTGKTPQRSEIQQNIE